MNISLLHLIYLPIARSLGPEKLQEFYAKVPQNVQELTMVELLGVDASPQNLDYVIHDVKRVNYEGVADNSKVREALLPELPKETKNILDDIEAPSEEVSSLEHYKRYLDMIDDLEAAGDPEAKPLREYFLSVMKKHEKFEEFLNEDKNRVRLNQLAYIILTLC